MIVDWSMFIWCLWVARENENSPSNWRSRTSHTHCLVNIKKNNTTTRKKSVFFILFLIFTFFSLFQLYQERQINTFVSLIIITLFFFVRFVFWLRNWKPEPTKINFFLLLSLYYIHTYNIYLNFLTNSTTTTTKQNKKKVLKIKTKTKFKFITIFYFLSLEVIN